MVIMLSREKGEKGEKGDSSLISNIDERSELTK
jgi:hypothetical protein